MTARIEQIVTSGPVTVDDEVFTTDVNTWIVGDDEAVIVIDPANDCDLWTVGDRLQNPVVTQQDKESPLMANVRLDNVLMPEARKLTFPADRRPQVLAAALTGDPLYVAFDRPEGKVLVLTVNLDQGDLPLRTAFPIMFLNAMAWFAGNQGELREALATGATTEIDIPSTMIDKELVLAAPDGDKRKLPSGVAKATVGPLDKCGVWQVIVADPSTAPAEKTQPRPGTPWSCRSETRSARSRRAAKGSAAIPVAISSPSVRSSEADTRNVTASAAKTTTSAQAMVAERRRTPSARATSAPGRSTTAKPTTRSKR